MGAIDEVKQRTDIVEVISQYTSLTKSGRTFRGLCPFHSEKHPSFFVYPEQQSWHCYGACNTGGDVFSFVMKRQGTGFGEALRFLADRVGVKIPSQTEQEAGKDERESLYKLNELAAQYYHNLLLNSPAAKNARNYLAGRGFLTKTIVDFQLGFALNSWDGLKQYLGERGYTDKELVAAGLLVEAEDGQTRDLFRNRLIFPIFDIRGHVTGFGGRVLDDALPKYINSPQTIVFDKSSTLYGINLAQAAVRQQDMAVIVEGYVDVIIAHQSGFSNVVASMGTSITEKQLSILKRLTKNVALALDADAAGEEAMLRAVSGENVLGAEIKVLLLPAGKDPDEVIREDAESWPRLLAGASPVIDFAFSKVAAETDLATARGKSLAVDKLLPIVAEIRDPLRQAHYRQKLARLVQVTERDLETALGGMKASKTRWTSRQPIEPRQQAMKWALRPLLSSPVEEYCLALLLQHPELRSRCGEILPEYFENSENREIFLAYTGIKEVQFIKERIDSSLHEHFDSLIGKSLPATQVEQRFSNCTLRLREKFLRSLERKKEAVLALEAEKGTSAELAKLKEQGNEVAAKLKEIFIKRKRGKQGEGG